MSSEIDFTNGGNNLAEWLGQTPKTEDNALEAILPTQATTEKTTEEEKPEEVVVVDPPKVEEPKALEDILPKTATTADSQYGSIVKQLLEDGFWEDGQITIETEEGAQEVLLSELSDIDEDTFKALKEGQKKLKDEEFQNKYLSKEGLDERTLKLIEIAKNGGDIRELLQVQAEVVNPLEGLDLEDSAVQEWIVAQTLLSQGHDQVIVQNTIAQYKKDLVLDAKADAIVKDINNRYDAQIEAKLEQRKQEKAKEAENQKLFRKSISEEVKKLGLKDTLQKNLVDLASKFDENGVSNADNLYFEAKKDPALFAEIVFLMSNKQAYEEFKGIKATNSAAKKNFITILKTDKKVASTQIEKAKTETENPLNKFIVTQ